jgi:hypothetical protein
MSLAQGCGETELEFSEKAALKMVGFGFGVCRFTDGLAPL